MRTQDLALRHGEMEQLLTALLDEGILQRIGDDLALAPQQAGAERKRRLALIQRMWLAGASEREVAQAAGTYTGQISRDIHKMREWGWYLPYKPGTPKANQTPTPAGQGFTP